MGDVLVKSRTDDEAERAARSADTEQRTGEGRKEFAEELWNLINNKEVTQ